jgi:outer membrane protein
LRTFGIAKITNMRYVNFGLTVVLFVLIGVLFSRVSQLEKTPAPTVVAPKPTPEKIQDMIDGQSKPVTVAYVDLDTLLENYDRHKSLRKKLEAKFERLERDFKAQVKNFEKDLAYFEQEAPRMGEQELQRAQMDLARLEQQIMQMREQRTKELVEEESRLNKDIKDEMDVVVEAMQAELGIDFILLKEPSGVLVGAKPDYDVTWMVLERLNAKKTNQKSK